MGSRDLISNLPDEILGKILSLLWTNRAACTSVLSKRWRNLLALVDNLELNDASGNHRYFCDFVDTTLALLSNPTTIKRFSLTCAFEYDSSRVNTWIRTVLDRGCLELYLETDSTQFIDTEFFTSNTLVKLTICDGVYPEGRLPPGGLFFPKLKTLSLHHVDFDCDIYEDLISGCPLLEELFLYYEYDDREHPLWCSMVSSLSVKRLTIFHHFPKHRDEAHDCCSLQTPSLVYLDYTSYVADQYGVDLGSLVEARLDLLSWERLRDKGDGVDDSVFYYVENVFGDVTNLVAGISNIKTLHLSPNSLEVLYFRCKSMPVFHNLLTLSFESDEERGWQVVPLLLNNSPNLETLVIKGLVHQVTRTCGNACTCVFKRQKKKKKMRTEERVCCLSTCQVKILNISAYQGTCRELKQMRHFLGNLKCLESVNVEVEVNRRKDKDVNNKYLKITDALMQLPRVSSNCQIHFF